VLFLFLYEITYLMKTIINIFFTAVFVLLLAHFLPHVQVADFKSAVLVAIVLALLNLFVKPILILLTLPATIVTFGLFLLVVNAIIIMLCDYFIAGFKVDNLITAIIFSLVLSLCQSVVNGLYSDDRK